MTKPKLTVIEGGLAASIDKRPKYFLSAYVTDTRLMGVLAVHACWKIPYGDELSDFHQFFYIDCEEMGLETYKSFLDSDPSEIEMAEQALVGGLGASKIEISERQLMGLLTEYRLFNENHKLPLPEKYEEYRFLIEPETILTPEESHILMKLICGEIRSDYQTINYFLMRCFGRDYTGAAYLSEGKFPLDLYDNYRQATFCKNVIDKDASYVDGATAYMCESLIEMNNCYETVISRVVVRDLKIVDFEHCSGFAVSSAEAAMMLSKPEFVTVYEVLLSEQDMDENIGELTITLNTVMSVHDNGRLFMAFKPSNSHVDSRIFRLSNDVRGIYFLTDYGQLIMAAYSLIEIQTLERKLAACPLAPFLMATAKYEFKEPVLFEFINSDFEDFEDFLEAIKDD
ncbi:MAG: hypothetical protein SOV50_01780 [Lentihominibacter sp.]|nr:hypothetical protein [Lentihominibacter sp.]